MGFVKKNLTLILAFLIPLLLIFTVAITAYFPFSVLKTEYNFVYAACHSSTTEYTLGCESYAKSLYTIENNRLIMKQVSPQQDADNNGTPDIEENYNVRLFLHNTIDNESREISFEDAQKLQYDSLLTSPDDVTITSGYSDSGFFLFDRGSSYGFYLTKGKLRSRLNLINDNRYYSHNNFHFIGWVLK